MHSNHFTFSLLTLIVLSMPLFGWGQSEEALWQPYYITPREGDQHLDLSRDWELNHTEDTITNLSSLPSQGWITVQQPTSVQMALYQAGELPNPYEHLNAQQYDWTEKKVWYYRKKFTLPATDNHLFLCFDGIDYFSKVWINGTSVGQHKGMWSGPMIYANDWLRLGQENEIVVEVKAANYDQWEDFNWREPGNIIKTRTFAGGDSHKPFFALGMWKGVRIESVPEVHMERPFLVTQQVNEQDAELKLSAEVFIGTHSLEYQLHPLGEKQISNYSNRNLAPANDTISDAISLKLELLSGDEVTLTQAFPVYALKGRSWLEESFTVSNPRLWYPNGLGESHLYKVRLSLLRNGEVQDQLTFDYGIRTITQKRSAGPRTGDRWEDWQFLVNNRPLFIKGVNWMPMDPLYDFPPEKYEWLISTAQRAGIQMIRIWGGGLLETEAFYDACNRYGIMVWQDFPLNNFLVPEWPQDVWETQVTHNIFRLRNQPSLAVWCGGNEFNPYAHENAAVMNILERSLNDFDPTRLWLRTSPDHGSTHLYPDYDPSWYKKILSIVPYVAETGMHSIPEASSLYEIVNAEEFENLGAMYDESFAEDHPEFVQHFMEYNPSRVPRMLSRASHIGDMSNPSLKEIAEATQIGAGEFYQVMSESLQSNYPVTTGLMPWVFKRPWPTVAAIHLLDGFGQPSAPYYFLKRTYEPIHASLEVDRLLWQVGESFPIKINVMNATEESSQTSVTVTIYNQQFDVLKQQQQKLSISAGPSVSSLTLADFMIPKALENQYFFITAELKDNNDQLISRSVYWPRTIPLMQEEAFRDQYLAEPISWPTLDEGPWLKPTVAQTKAKLSAELLDFQSKNEKESNFTLKLKNQGTIPAFMCSINVEGRKRMFTVDDNFFWLAAGEEKVVSGEIRWRELGSREKVNLTVNGFNSKKLDIQLKNESTNNRR